MILQFKLGKSAHSVYLQDGVIPLGDDKTLQAFNRWIHTPQGRDFLAGDETSCSSSGSERSWTSMSSCSTSNSCNSTGCRKKCSHKSILCWEEEHYLEDRLANRTKQQQRRRRGRGNSPRPRPRRTMEHDRIDYNMYQVCKYNCKKDFYYTGEHDCSVCGIIACKTCANNNGGTKITCSVEGCNEWICGHCRRNQDKCRYHQRPASSTRKGQLRKGNRPKQNLKNIQEDDDQYDYIEIVIDDEYEDTIEKLAS